MLRSYARNRDYSNPLGFSFLDPVSPRLTLNFEDQSYGLKELNKAFSDVITFTRATTGTYVDSAGLIQEAAIDVPRFDYSTGRRGLLIEEQRTNLTGFSTDPLTHWNDNGTTSEASTEVARDGTLRAVKAFPVEASTNHFLTANLSASFTSGVDYTFSIDLKEETGNRAQITGTSGAFGSAQYANFLLSGAGSVSASAGGTASIKAVGNDGWYRCTFTVQASATTTGTSFILSFVETGLEARLPTFLPGGGNSLHYDLAQTEAGSFPTSPIETASIAVTRAADNCKIDGTNFSDWYNQAEGAMIIALNSDDNNAAGFPKALEISDGTADQRMNVVRRDSPEGYKYEVKDGGVTQAGITRSGTVFGQDVKIGLGYKLNDFAIVIDGGTVSTDTSGTVPTVDRIHIGTDRNGAGSFSGGIYSITYYSTLLSDAQLQELTSL